MPTPKYTARTLLRVPPEGRFLLSTSEPVPDMVNHQKTQVILVKTRLVLNSALKQPKVAELSMVREHVDPVEWLEKQVQADFTVAPEVLRIAMSGDRPDELVILVDAIREAYRREILDKERFERNDRLNKLRELRQKFEADLRTQKDEQRFLEQKAGSRDASARALILAFTQQEIHGTERELLQTRSELRKAKLELTVYQANDKRGLPVLGASTVGLLGSPLGQGPCNAAFALFPGRTEAKLPELAFPDPVVDEHLDKNPGIQPLNTEIQLLQYQIEDTMKLAQRGENEPAVKTLRRKLADKQAAMLGLRKRLRPQVLLQLQDKARYEFGRNVNQLKARISLLEEQEVALSQEIEHLREKLREMANNSTKLDASLDDLTQLETITKKITFEEEALKVELQAPSRVRVVEEAVLQHQDSKNRQATTTGLAAAGTLALVLLSFAWWEFRSRRVDSAEDVAQGLGLKVVGAIPDSSPPSWIRIWKSRRCSSQDLRTESIDAARTMLLEVARVRSLRVVLITSAEPGEGKTSMVTRLAVSLAQIGYKTLLIDGDLRNPMAHSVLNLSNGPGLCELLRGEVDVAAAVQPTAVPALSMISAGRWDNRATCSLPQERAVTVFHQLRSTFDFILIDSSPLLPIVDPLLLSQHADGALLSVLCNVSRLQNVYAAHQRLTALGVSILGAVVNGVRGEVYSSPYRDYVANSTRS
jgi:capsular exopolysaccharide synthesis family protein